ncbi:hypothetical protein ACB092_06G178300 [Castanea dentata]
MEQSIPPIAKKSTTKRGQREINFTIDEDIKLVSAWLNISLDAKFNHTKDSLNSRWSTIQRMTNKFCGCLAQIENRNESDTKAMYLSNSKNAFQLEHCWRILRNEAKWWILRDNLKRVIGKKAKNEKLKKRKNCDDVVPMLSSQLDEIKEEKRRIHEEKKESMRIAFEERRELIRIKEENNEELIHINEENNEELIHIKEERNEVEKRKMEDEIMMKDTRTMDLEQKEYIRLRRLEILESLRSKFPS